VFCKITNHFNLLIHIVPKTATRNYLETNLTWSFSDLGRCTGTYHYATSLL